MIMRKLRIFCIASSVAVLAACGSGNAPASPTTSAANASSTPLIASVVDHALDRAETKLRNENITISDNDGIVVFADTNTDDNRTSRSPKAQITPQGDLLIGGKPVALTPAQHAEMLAYRKQLVEIARQGIAIGRQGATLGVNAAGAAIAGVFSGESEQQIRQRVEAKASGIRAAAAKICDRLPDLMTSQQKLAVDVPAFKPYATMTQKDIEDCRKSSLKDDND